MADYTREQALQDLGEVLAGLQVPISMRMPLGTTTEPWHRLRAGMNMFGWDDPEAFVEALGRTLDGTEPVSEEGVRKQVAKEIRQDVICGQNPESRGTWDSGMNRAARIASGKLTPRKKTR